MNSAKTCGSNPPPFPYNDEMVLLLRFHESLREAWNISVRVPRGGSSPPPYIYANRSLPCKRIFLAMTHTSKRIDK